ncbi:MAG: hypothetical protein M5U21_01055 [Fimbriimonadaceae bacterium]|nr:hypothetical protein [Fimbriimonadaceae bacterium]
MNSRSITILCVGALVLAGCSSKKPDDTKPNAVGSNSPKPGVDSPIPEGLLPSPLNSPSLRSLPQKAKAGRKPSLPPLNSPTKLRARWRI